MRRGAEQAVQKSPEKAKRSRELLGHSVDTGANIYNKNDDATRAKFITGCAKREGSDATANQESSKKLKLDKELRTKIAKETLSKRNDRKLKLGPKCSLLPDDKKVIQEVFSKENYRSITKLNPAKKFPGNIVRLFCPEIFHFSFKARKLGKKHFIVWWMEWKVQRTIIN